MNLSEVGEYWLWLLIAAWWGIRLADKNRRRIFAILGQGFWEFGRCLWRAVTDHRKAQHDIHADNATPTSEDDEQVNEKEAATTKGCLAGVWDLVVAIIFFGLRNN